MVLKGRVLSWSFVTLSMISSPHICFMVNMASSDLKLDAIWVIKCTSLYSC